MPDIDIFGLGLNFLILLFTLGLIYIVAVYMVGGYIHPLFQSESLLPDTDTAGISRSMYQGITDKLWGGLQMFFYIILAIPFIYVLVKYFYEREETSVRY